MPSAFNPRINPPFYTHMAVFVLLASKDEKPISYLAPHPEFFIRFD